MKILIRFSLKKITPESGTDDSVTGVHAVNRIRTQLFDPSSQRKKKTKMLSQEGSVRKSQNEMSL